MPLAALSISVFLSCVAIAAVAVKYVWIPHRDGRDLRERLLRAGIEARSLPRKSFVAMEFPARQWTVPGDADRLKQRIRETAAKTSGLEVRFGQAEDLLLTRTGTGCQDADRVGDLALSQAQLVFEVGAGSQVRIVCRVRSGLAGELFWVLFISLFIAAYFSLLGLRSNLWRPYLPAAYVALAGAYAAYSLARGPGQRMLIEKFLDSLILESVRPT